MTSHPPRTVLIMGLVQGVADLSGWSKEKVLAAVEEQKARLAEMNVTIHNYQIDPQLPLSKLLADIRELLENRRWDGVSVGFGVRGNEDFTGIFTGVMNLIVEEGKTNEGETPKLLCALRPNKLIDEVQRVWPEYA